MTDLPFDRVLRTERARVLATLIRLTGDIGVAEDAVQDAVEQAVRRWPIDGAPDNPAAWLTTVARRRALDVLRREAQRPRRETAAVLLDQLGGSLGERTSDSMVDDDLLRLIFTCCHPALAPESRIALTLRTLCGLSTQEIAKLLLIPDTTLGQRISRAKRKIVTARIPYRVPADHELPDRLAAVLAVVHAIVTAGHHAPHGALDGRADLGAEGVRLARLLHRLMPDEPECAGLLALALATQARRAARLDERGEVVLLADQDRTRWRHDEIAEADGVLTAALRRGRSGPYQLQAAIACVHGLAATAADTDWAEIGRLYRMLEDVLPTPVVRVNRAIAVAELDGPGHGLAMLDTVAGDLDDWHLYWSTRGELLARCGDRRAAAEAFDRALRCSPNDSDRRFLARRRATLTHPT